MTQPDLDQLLHLLGTLGADAAWLLVAAEEARLVWSDGEAEHPLSLLDEARQDWSPLLIARFPADADAEFADPGVTELRLPAGGDREIRAAAILSIAMDQLTKLGPNATRRVLEWVLTRYGASASLYVIQDRRPQRSPPPAPVALPPDPVSPATESNPRIERAGTLRSRRQALGFTQRMLAERANLTPSRISAIEIGNSIPGDAVWDRIEHALTRAEQEAAEQD